MYILALDPGTAHCGYALMTCDPAHPAQIAVICAGSQSLETVAGREALRTVARESAAEGCRHWVTERPWRGLTVGQRLDGGGPARASRIHAAQTATIRQIGEMLEAAGIPRSGRLPAISPSTAKRVLAGSGTATKAQMMQAAQLRFGVWLTEHAADAVAVGLAAAQAYCVAQTRRRA